MFHIAGGIVLAFLIIITLPFWIRAVFFVLTLTVYLVICLVVVGGIALALVQVHNYNCRRYLAHHYPPTADTVCDDVRGASN